MTAVILLVQFSVRKSPIRPPPGCRMAVRARSPDDVHIARDHDKKKCLRCKYIRLRQKWSSRVMDGAEVMITEQPDPEKPWGLGCVVCSRYCAWLKTDKAASSSDEAGA